MKSFKAFETNSFTISLNSKIKATTELITNEYVEGKKDSLQIDFSAINPNYMVKLREHYKNLILVLAKRK